MKEYQPLPASIEEIGRKIISAAYKVHSSLGPGLLEKIYEICLTYELQKMRLKAERQVIVPVKYDELVFEEGLRIDILVENTIIVEVKAVDLVNPIWKAQVLSYLKMTNKRLGFVLNFNVMSMKEGIQRVIL
ncbi:GxxExxY protein [Emticicia sp. 21SJ11W-3]|nr:GxxExxY protein [Emticicia sp. 21SJ11W-3]UTA68244.1 GxxExxY protein [Emticicia sp. 21SJ11W-3]